MLMTAEEAKKLSKIKNVELDEKEFEYIVNFFKARIQHAISQGEYCINHSTKISEVNKKKIIDTFTKLGYNVDYYPSHLTPYTAIRISW